MGPVDLVKAPEEVLGGAVDIVPTRVVWEVVAQGRAAELLSEKVDLVQEEDDAGPDEPPRVDDGVEQHETLHHAVLVTVSQATHSRE